MKYLCLIYQDTAEIQNLPKTEFDKLRGEYLAFAAEIKKSGRFLGSNALQPARTATTVRVRNGKIATTDGPFAETKEQLGGYYLIEGGDRDEAVQIAAKIPSARFASVEVRPVWEIQ